MDAARRGVNSNFLLFSALGRVGWCTGRGEFEWGVGMWDGAPPTCSTSTPSFYPAFLNC